MIREVVAILSVLVTARRDGADGQGLAEYALLLSLIAIVCIAALLFMGGAISEILSTIGVTIQNPGP